MSSTNVLDAVMRPCASHVPGVYIRPMSIDDVPSVVALDGAGWSPQWRPADFRESILHDGGGLVAELLAGELRLVIGSAIFATIHNDLCLLRLTIAPGARRRKIGSALLGRVINRRESGERLRAVVIETNLESCKFLAANGFRATRVLREFCENSGADAFEFVFGE